MTANLISYSRTTLILPTLVLLSKEFCLVPALFVLANNFLDIFDGIVARYWLQKKDKDEICFVLDTDSTTIKRRKRDFGAYMDAVLDKLFVVPLWIFLLSHLDGAILVSLVLWPLIFIETASGFVRTVAYCTAVGTSAPTGIAPKNSSITSDHVGKTKQTLEMFGSALLLIPFTYYVGLFILFLSWPLAVESVRRKLQVRVVYVTCDQAPLRESQMLFLEKAKSLGTKLVVGIETKSKDGTDYEQRRREILMLPYVDACIDAAPPLSLIDLAWMEKSQVDKIVVMKREAAGMAQTMLKSNDVWQL
jgi:phosphatidylglycerophosphate synthase